jgi:hypothetical protein
VGLDALPASLVLAWHEQGVLLLKATQLAQILIFEFFFVNYYTS